MKDDLNITSVRLSEKAFEIKKELREPPQIITHERQNSTYWQETRARQEYYNSLTPGLWDPK